MLQNLTVSLQFKTVRKNALLFYVELISKRDGGAYDFGFIEVGTCHFIMKTYYVGCPLKIVLELCTYLVCPGSIFTKAD